MIVGIDEVGRGAWAGPLVVAAVMLGGETIDGLTDSKKLSKKRREALDLEIRQKATAVGLGWVSARQIDEIGLSLALKLAAKRAISHIRTEYKEIIIDGTIALLDDHRVTTMAKADLLVPSVSAASIVAKVARDRYMAHLDELYPGYKFSSHVGYGTAMHKIALIEHGVTSQHRLSFEPLRDFRPEDFKVGENLRSLPKPLTTKSIGDNAETAAAMHLLLGGHTILERNWRTKRCEIDIVSRYENTVYFTEVKYRKRDDQGGGLAAVTAKKLKQMNFAAEYYLHSHGMQHSDAMLAVADVTGQPPKVEHFLELR